MIKHLSEKSPLPNTDSLSAQRPNRRAFLLTAASAAGLAAWRPSLAFASSAGGGTPGAVTIVEFSDAGKPTGKASIPRVVRSDAEWKQKLTPISFEVTRHAGTERPYTGSTWNNHDHRFHLCICC